ncbi:MAG: hypothetical protein IBJ10_03930 [Phycisphaerales bacterium]|nr:hypothetical protein [Phycisphaerales bacterium]
MHSPRGALAMLETPRRLTPLRIAVQVVGFAIGVALLVWCVALAVGKADPEQWSRLRASGWAPAAWLLGLTLFTVVFNGLAFWVTLLPLRRLKPADLIAVNALATMLAYLPFKLGALARVVIHRRRDNVPFRDIIAWLAGYSALSLATLVPLVVVVGLRPRLDALTVGLALAGALAANGAGVALGRLSERRTWLAALSMGSWRVVRHPAPVAMCAGAKLADVAVHAARFTVAAGALGIDLSLDRAVVFALAYFLLGVLSPVGMVGIREGGLALGGAALFALDEAARADLARLVLLVSASEVVAIVPLAFLGGAWLRVDRLLWKRS